MGEGEKKIIFLICTINAEGKGEKNYKKMHAEENKKNCNDNE